MTETGEYRTITATPYPSSLVHSARVPQVQSMARPRTRASTDTHTYTHICSSSIHLCSLSLSMRAPVLTIPHTFALAIPCAHGCARARAQSHVLAIHTHVCSPSHTRVHAHQPPQTITKTARARTRVITATYMLIFNTPVLTIPIHAPVLTRICAHQPVAHARERVRGHAHVLIIHAHLCSPSHTDAHQPPRTITETGEGAHSCDHGDYMLVTSNSGAL